MRMHLLRPCSHRSLAFLVALSFFFAVVLFDVGSVKAQDDTGAGAADTGGGGGGGDTGGDPPPSDTGAGAGAGDGAAAGGANGGDDQGKTDTGDGNQTPSDNQGAGGAGGAGGTDPNDPSQGAAGQPASGGAKGTTPPAGGKGKQKQAGANPPAQNGGNAAGKPIKAIGGKQLARQKQRQGQGGMQQGMGPNGQMMQQGPMGPNGQMMQQGPMGPNGQPMPPVMGPNGQPMPPVIGPNGQMMQPGQQQLPGGMPVFGQGQFSMMASHHMFGGNHGGFIAGGGLADGGLAGGNFPMDPMMPGGMARVIEGFIDGLHIFPNQDNLITTIVLSAEKEMTDQMRSVNNRPPRLRAVTLIELMYTLLSRTDEATVKSDHHKDPIRYPYPNFLLHVQLNFDQMSHDGVSAEREFIISFKEQLSRVINPTPPALTVHAAVHQELNPIEKIAVALGFLTLLQHIDDYVSNKKKSQYNETTKPVFSNNLKRKIARTMKAIGVRTLVKKIDPRSVPPPTLPMPHFPFNPALGPLGPRMGGQLGLPNQPFGVPGYGGEVMLPHNGGVRHPHPGGQHVPLMGGPQLPYGIPNANDPYNTGLGGANQAMNGVNPNQAMNGMNPNQAMNGMNPNQAMNGPMGGVGPNQGPNSQNNNQPNNAVNGNQGNNTQQGNANQAGQTGKNGPQGTTASQPGGAKQPGGKLPKGKAGKPPQPPQ